METKASSGDALTPKCAPRKAVLLVEGAAGMPVAAAPLPPTPTLLVVGTPRTVVEIAGGGGGRDDAAAAFG